ncbi:hypothetical protein OH77DRAFT_1520007 [Trametes cingulata]|nr:hypothetical protein OH77DRAFT_1520007 [Trametes cingulata]
MSNSRVYRAFDPALQPRAGGLLGGGDGGGLLGDPLSGLPGLGGLSSALSPILTPIGLPGPGKSTATTSASQTSATSTISLTSGTSSATSTSSAATTSATTSATTTSNTSSLPSGSQTSTSADTQPPATDSLTTSPTATPPPQPTTSAADASLPASTATSTVTTSASPSATAAGDNAPKGFLQNKALSVGVITAASLVGLVLLVALATWAIRKRNRDRLHQDILDFSTANLVHDAEKGSGGGGGAGSGGDGRREMFADEGGSSNGHGSAATSSSGHGAYSQPPLQPRGMYEAAAYPVVPASAYAPPPPKPTPSRAANPYPAYADRQYAFPSQEQPPHQQNTYANWGYGYGAPAPAPVMQPQQNQFDQAYAGVDDAYGGIAASVDQPGVMAGVGAGAQSQGPAATPQRRPSAHRKPPPQLYIPPANPIAQAVSGGNALSPVTQPTRRTSLLNSPPAGADGGKRERRDTLTHVELLDPAAPKVPAASPPLPDEFGTGAVPASKDSPPEQPVRRLVVRNE